MTVHLVPPPIAQLEEYRERRNARLAQGIDPTPLDARRFDLARLTREVHEEMERVGDYPLDAA